jgi:hypothetical protein
LKVKGEKYNSDEVGFPELDKNLELITMKKENNKDILKLIVIIVENNLIKVLYQDIRKVVKQ